MALIKCLDCQTIFPDRLLTCPRCKWPVQLCNRYTVTFVFHAIGRAKTILSTVVSGAIDSVIIEVHKHEGRVVDFKVSNQRFASSQTAVIVYYAPEIVFERKTCTVTIRKKRFARIPDADFVWSD